LLSYFDLDGIVHLLLALAGDAYDRAIASGRVPEVPALMNEPTVAESVRVLADHRAQEGILQLIGRRDANAPLGAIAFRAFEREENHFALEASHGLVFSHRLLLALVDAGLPRDDAYRLVQRHAMRAWEDATDFGELVRADPEIARRVDLEAVFDLEATIRHVHTVFDRLHALVQKEVPVHA